MSTNQSIHDEMADALLQVAVRQTELYAMIKGVHALLEDSPAASECDSVCSAETLTRESLKRAKALGEDLERVKFHAVKIATEARAVEIA